MNKDIVWRLHKYLRKHERACIMDVKCPVCSNYLNWKLIDKDIDKIGFKNFCRDDFQSNLKIFKISKNAQRIHVIGNHWPLINGLDHRKFKFFANKNNKFGISYSYATDSVITDVDLHVSKYASKMIITQGYNINYSLKDLDWIIVEKQYVEDFLKLYSLKLLFVINEFLIVKIIDSEIESLYTA